MSTALTEETLSECLKSSTYESTTPKNAAVGCSGVKDDVKCSICQVFSYPNYYHITDSCLLFVAWVV